MASETIPPFTSTATPKPSLSSAPPVALPSTSNASPPTTLNPTLGRYRPRNHNVLLHLPNIVFRLLKMPDLPPNQAAFRIPKNLTKLDIRNYLTQIYGMEPLEIRTMNSIRKRKATAPFFTPTMNVKVKIFKKAIVTLPQPFEWPPTPSLTELFHLNMHFPPYQSLFNHYTYLRNMCKSNLKHITSKVERQAEELKLKEYTDILEKPFEFGPFEHYLPRSLSFDHKYFNQTKFESSFETWQTRIEKKIQWERKKAQQRQKQLLQENE